MNHNSKVSFLIILFLLFIIFIVLGSFFLDRISLTRLGISLQIIGGLLVAPDAIVFIIGSERIKEYESKTDQYISKMTRILQIRAEAYKELLRFTWYRNKVKKDIVDEFIGGCAHFIFIFQSTSATSLWLISIFLYWLNSKNTEFAIQTAVVIIIARLVFQIQFELISPLLNGKTFFKPVELMFSIAHLIFLIPYKILLEIVPAGFFYLIALIVYILESGVESIKMKPTKAKRILWKKERLAEISSTINNSTIAQFFGGLPYYIGYPIKWLGDITIFIASNLIAFVPHKIFLYFTYPFRSNQKDKYGLLIGFMVAITGNILQFVATWK